MSHGSSSCFECAHHMPAKILIVCIKDTSFYQTRTNAKNSYTKPFALYPVLLPSYHCLRHDFTMLLYMMPMLIILKL